MPAGALCMCMASNDQTQVQALSTGHGNIVSGHVAAARMQHNQSCRLFWYNQFWLYFRGVLVLW